MIHAHTPEQERIPTITDDDRLKLIANINFIGKSAYDPDELAPVFGLDGRLLTYREVAKIQHNHAIYPRGEEDWRLKLPEDFQQQLGLHSIPA